MAYQWLSWLADALRAEGCEVAEESGWSTRGRPSSTGSFAPYGVCWHHTGTTSSASNPAPTLAMCISGRSDLPGPLCHVVIGYDGRCHVIAAGRANHAGENDGTGPFPPGDANAQLVGFEIDYNGTQPMSAAQKDAATKASAACLRRFGRAADYAVRHAETSTTGKWDTGGVGGDEIRSMVSKQLAGGEGDDFDMATVEEVTEGVWNVPMGKSGVDMGIAQQRIYDSVMSGNATWNRPLGHEGFDMEVAFQRIYTWCNQMQADIAAIKAQLE